MLTAVGTEQDDRVGQVVGFAWQEADILTRLARQRLLAHDGGKHVHRTGLATPAHFVRWAQQIAEALIRGARSDIRTETASRIWARVRMLLMADAPERSVDEFVIYHLTRNQYEGFPYGLAVSDLGRLAGDEFPKAKIRTAMARLARRDLIRKCHTRRVTRRPGNRIPTREFVWFYAGPSSLYAEAPEAVSHMHTPRAERPSEHAA